VVSVYTDESSSRGSKSLVFSISVFLFNVFFPSKRDNELLLRLIANLNMLLKDDSVNVVKKAILTLTQMYKVSLQVNTSFVKYSHSQILNVWWRNYL